MSPMSPRLLRPRQTLHPDAAAWAARVVSNGGSVTGTTLSAVSKFCASIASAGLRDRFYRLNLFCGTGLNACLVPLYRGPSLGGTQYGNTVDTNVGPFVSGDYNETGAVSGGLLGNGSSKYLDTGVTIDGIGARTSSHISVYHSQPSGSNQTRFWIAGKDSASASAVYLGNGIFSTPAVFGTLLGNSTANFNTGSSQSGAAGGHRTLSRTSVSSLVNYYNAVSQASSTTNITGAISGVAAAKPIFVFANNSNGTTDSYMNGRIMAYSIGYGMTQQQVTDYHNAMQTFQAALTRNV